MLQEHHQMTHNGMQRNPRMGLQQMGPPPNQRTPMLMSMPTTGVLVSMSPGGPGPALITPQSLPQQQQVPPQPKPGMPPQPQPPQVYHFTATQEAAQVQQATQSQQLPAPPSVAPPPQPQPPQQEADLSQQHGSQDQQSPNCPNTNTSSMSNSTLANIKEKTPMCLVNELARYNKIQHQYRLTGETGPAHKKVFTVTLKLGNEEYEAEGPSIKKAQHSAAAKALTKTELKHPPLKTLRGGRPTPRPGAPPGHGHAIPPTVELNALAMKRGERTVYVVESGGTPPHQVRRSFRPNPGVVLYQQGYAGGAAAYYPRHPPGGYAAGGPPSRFGYESRCGGGGGGPRGGPPQAAAAAARPPPPAGPYGPPPPYDPTAARYYGQPPFRPPPGQVPGDSRYTVRLRVGEREYPGHGYTIQAARHDAAAKALEHIKQMGGIDTTDTVIPENGTQQPVDMEGTSPAVAAAGDVNADLKSPISLVYEIALKRNLNVAFDVLSEKGPPHMKLFVTQCRVGNFVAEGEGNSKKISKKRAAEKMLDEMSKLPPIPITTSYSQLRRKRITTKKKTRNLIKVNVDKNAETSEEINPISRLIQIQQANKEREPVYTVLEERGAPRRREFVIEASVNGHTVTGVGPNKKVAKRNAAEALLAELGYSSNGTPLNAPKSSPKVDKENDAASANVSDKNRKVTFVEDKQEQQQQQPQSQPSVGGSGGRQLVPGVLLVTEQNAGFTKPKNADDKTQTVPQLKNPPPPGVRSKDQLLYLAQLMNIQVQFSDFPKANHEQYLTLVSLGTSPPQVCHGEGQTTEASHEKAACEALRVLSTLGLDCMGQKNAAGKEQDSVPPGDSKVQPNQTGVKK